MALSHPTKPTDPDQACAPMAGLEYHDATSSHHQQKHRHLRAQLLYCRQGLYEVEINKRFFLVPPTSAVWIPADVLHCGFSAKTVHFQSLYFDSHYFSSLPNEVAVLRVSSLFKELIQRAITFSWDYKENSTEARLAAVIADEIQRSKAEPYHLPLSPHPTLRQVRRYLLDNLESKPNSTAVATKHHISNKTLNRLCQREIGMTFEQWRQQIKLLHAIGLLAQGHSTTFVAQSLGYSHDSAFIYMFKQQTGKPPSEFIKSLR